MHFSSLRSGFVYLLLNCLLLFTSNAILAQGTSADYEIPELLKASDLFAPEVVEGDIYKINEGVVSNGAVNHYVISSDYGEFNAVGIIELRTRLKEISALADLDDLSKSQVFLEAAANAGLSQIQTVQQFSMRFASNPVEVVLGVPQGITNTFSRYLAKANKVIADAGDVIGSTMNSDSGNSADSGNSDVDMTNEAIGLTEDYFNVSNAQRSLARKLGVDPYSDNQILQEALNSYAWAESLGSFSTSLVDIPEVPGADVMYDINDLLWSQDPYELEQLNRSRLATVTASEELVSSYLAHPHFTPALQTQLTAAILELEEVQGREDILRDLIETESRQEVAVLIETTSLLAWYHHNQTPLTNLTTNTPLPAGETAEGKLVLLLPVDYIYWTESNTAVAGIYSALKDETEEKEMWILGKASSLTVNKLTESGWRVYADLFETLGIPLVD